MAIQVAHLTGKTISEFLESAVIQAVMPYATLNGGRMELRPRKGFYLRGATVYEKKIAENEGREIEVVPELCTILEFTEMYGSPYYKIRKDGLLMKVPAKVIKEVPEDAEMMRENA